MTSATMSNPHTVMTVSPWLVALFVCKDFVGARRLVARGRIFRLVARDVHEAT